MTDVLTLERAAVAALHAFAREELIRRETAPRDRPSLSATPFRPVLPLPSRLESDLAHLASDPIGTALRLAVRRVGEELFRLGGLDALQRAYDRLEGGRVLSLVDHAWDGIGDDAGRWWA